MKRKLVLNSALIPAALLATSAMGQVVNFHDDVNGYPYQGPVNSGAYDALYAGQGAYADPGNNIWNGFGIYNATVIRSTYVYSDGPGGNAPWPQQAGNPGNPYAAYLNPNSGWLSSTGTNLFNFATYSPTNTGNATSAGTLTHITLKVGGYTGDTSTAPEFIPNGIPEFLFSADAYKNTASPTETFTLQHVPVGTYGLYLYSANPGGNNRGTTFALNSGNAHNGIASTLNTQVGSVAANFVEGQDYVIFENVTPDGSGNITITATPNAADGSGNSNLGGEVDVNGFQLIFNPLPTAQDYTRAQNVIAGTTASFSFNPVFASGATFKWQVVKAGATNNLTDGSGIAGSGTTNLTIASVSSANVGSYQCVITTATATNTSPAAPLTIITSTALLVPGNATNVIGGVLQPGDALTDIGESAPNLFYQYLPMNAVPEDINLGVADVEDGTLVQYVNLGSGGTVAPFSGPVGFSVTPKSGATIVTGIRFYTASSRPEDDPADYTLLGSTDGVTFSPISGGTLSLPAQRNLSFGTVNVTNDVIGEVSFANTNVYTSYELMFTNVKNDTLASNGVQLAEVQLLGSLPAGAPGVVSLSSSTNVQISGTTMSATVFPSGPGPLMYQWAVNTTNIPNATNATLTITNLQPTNSGNYTVTITSPYGTTNATLNLTVLAATPYESAVLSYNPLGFWPLNETSGTIAYDVVGGHNGTYTGGFLQAQPGVPDAGFGTPSYSAQFYSGGYVDIPEGPFNITGPVTIMGWFYAPSDSSFENIMGHGDSSYRVTINGNAGDPGFNDGNSSNGDATSGKSVLDGNWHFITGVYTGGSGTTGFLYIDGSLVASNDITGVPGNGLDLWIAGAPDYGTGRTFTGFLSHMAVIPNALTPSQVNAIYGAGGIIPLVSVPSSVEIDQGANGSIVGSATGTAPLYYQWVYTNQSSVGFTIAGATNSTLQLTNVQPIQATYNYYLVVSNAYGVTVSAPVAITVATQPGLVADIAPLIQQVPVGVPITFSVTASGAHPLTYQWSNGVTAISGATNSSYTFAAVAGSNNYSVGIYNSLGSAVSSTAVVEAGVPPVVSLTNGGNWYLNGSTLPTITGDLLQLTFNANGETDSAFYYAPQYVGGFVASFVYQASGNKAADGITFCLQNDATNATGGGGGELGYSGITNSFALEMNIYSGDHGGTGILFEPDGLTPDSTAGLQFQTTAPVNLSGGDPILVQLYYSQSQLSLWLTDQTSGTTYTTSMTTNIPAAVTANTAYIGFTGATGGLNANQTVSNFVYSFTTPPIISVTKGGTPGTVNVSWSEGVATQFVLEQSASLLGPWVNVGVSPAIVGTQNQVTLTPGATTFYRLNLQ